MLTLGLRPPAVASRPGAVWKAERGLRKKGPHLCHHPPRHRLRLRL